MALPVLLVGLGYSSERPLDMSEETVGIFDALINKARIDYLPNLTFDRLRDRFNQNGADEISVFHYIGHSSLKGIYADDKGTPKVIDVQFLSTLLAHQRLRLVFLNSCFSKELAEALRSLGVPVVIGTSDEVDNKDASLVACLFYQYLAGLGGSQTIIKAFELTTNELGNLQKQDKLNRKYTFRGLGNGGQRDQKFAWDIYYDNSSASERNWCLIPAKQDLAGFKKELFAKIDENNYSEVFGLIQECSWIYDRFIFNRLKAMFSFAITLDLVNQLKVFIVSIRSN